MLGYTTLSFSFDSDGQHCFQLQLWITETKAANLLDIEFCRKYTSKLHFDIPALELKDTPYTICYGSLCATKPYSYLSLIRAIRIPHQIHIDAKTSRFDRNFDCAILYLRSLKKVAKKFLTSPLSSVYSERLFSEFGNIYCCKPVILVT